MLAFLKDRRGEWVSGQILAERTAMTRAAVWKRIGVLREAGYGIEAVTRKGYRLQEIPDRLLPSEISDGLKTRIMGRGEIRHLEEAASTNQTAKEMAISGAPEGSLVVAEAQSWGRGRLDRCWFSPAGQGIYASLIIRPPLPPSEASRLVLLTAVAVAEALRETTGLAATIKWPNDILVGGRKMAGILTELAMEMDAVNYMVIGLGLNVNIDEAAFPAEFRSAATSVLLETGVPFSRVLLLRRFLEAFENRYLLFRESGFAPILARWKTLTDMTGRQVTVQTVGGSYRGKVAGFDGDGFLILRDEKGGKLRLVSGDVQMV
ncbi:MAG: biotin--[acetyl-CoA-carboxylase] ligase [Deltaproteobacteria bacterium]|nr:biotin--[acetyl-CoA-carboxylase] ligase [Deltaproteobacteria bacterium]